MLSNKKNRSTSKGMLRAALAVTEAMERRMLLSGAVTGTVYSDPYGEGFGDNGLPGRTVYADLNNNGQLDPGEPSALTDASGNFTLSNLPIGPTIIRQILLPGERQSYPAGGMGEHVTVGSAPISNLYFEATTDLYISGTVFTDTNRNGLQDNGEQGIAGEIVYADLNHDGYLEVNEPTATSNAAGQFVFDGLGAGTYQFRVQSPSTQPLGSPMTLTLPSGGVKLNANFPVVPVTPAAVTNSYGDMDVTSFGNAEGAFGVGTASLVTPMTNGQVLVTVTTTNAADKLALYQPDGTIETTFGKSGYAVTAGTVSAVMVQNTGDIVVAGQLDPQPYNNYGFIERFLPTGTLDKSFGSNGTGIVQITFGYNLALGSRLAVSALLPLPSGQFIVGGSVNYTPEMRGHFALERFNANGTVDTTFGGAGTGIALTDANPGFPQNIIDGNVTAMSLTSTGAILVAGWGDTSVSAAPLLIAQFTAAGLPDPTFGPLHNGVVTSDLGGDMRPDAILGLANGQLVVAGNFVNTFSASPPAQFSDAYSLRFNADGSIDSTYAVDGWQQASSDVSAATAVIYPDGSILFAGNDESSSRAALLSINAQGLPNNSFDANSPETIDPDLAQFIAVALTQQQRIVTLGQNYNYDNQPETGVVTRFLGAQAPAPGSVLSGGTLNITGTGLADVITVNRSSDGKSLLATVNGLTTTFACSTVKGILIDTLAGDDSVSISSAITINSTIFGGEGNDTLSGGSGNDLIYGNDGNDVLYGNAGNDTLYGGNGDDSLNGGTGNDIMYGEAGNDTLNGGLGNDSFYGGTGSNTADFSDRTDNLQLHIGFGKLGAKGENDYIANDIETLIGGSGNDTLNAGSGYDELIAGKGNDTLISGHGGATLIGGSGNDLFETKNNKFDTIIGGSGDNTAITDPFDIVTNVQHRST
jgi:uncharacterized delta-60 repeat protein